MKQIRTFGLLAALVTLVASPVGAQQIDSVSTSEATTGMTFTIDGSGFGTKRPKVELWDTAAGKKAKGTKLKATVFADDSITVEVKKAKEGTYDLVVRPKGKGIEPAMSDAPFSIAPVQNLTPADAAGDPGEEIMVTADFMGKQKAKVKIGGKKAKVTTWEPSGSPTEGGAGYFIFKVPKKLANGTYDIEVFNKTYNVMLPDFFEVENSNVGTGGGGGGGGAKFTCKIGGKSFKGTSQSLVYVTVPQGNEMVTSFAPLQASNPVKVWQFSFLYDPADGAAQISGGDILAVTYGEGLFPNIDTYVAANDFVIDITGVSGSDQLQGSVSGTLNKVGGSGPATLAVTNSSFVLNKADALP